MSSNHDQSDDFWEKLESASKRTGYPIESFVEILIAFDTPKPDEALPFKAEDVCVQVIKSISARYSEQLEIVLTQLEFETGIDIGRVFYEFVDLGLFKESKGDHLCDFEGHFQVHQIAKFLNQHSLKRNPRRARIAIAMMTGGVVFITIMLALWETVWKHG